MRKVMVKALCFLLLCATVALAQPNLELEKANQFLSSQKLAEAARALDAAARVPGNRREVVIRIYQLQGVVYGQLGQTTKAREAFSSLLSLDPGHELTGKHHPKVVAAFLAATRWAQANPALDFKAAKAAIEKEGRVVQLAVKVKGDSMRLVRKVRFHLRPDQASWSEQDAPMQGAYAAADTDAAVLQWWAELLGENDRVLSAVGSQEAPLQAGNLKERVASVEEPKDDDEVQVISPLSVPTPIEVVPGPTSSWRPLRPLGYALVGAGAAIVGVGVFFGSQSEVARGKVASATRDSQGRVTGITQKAAFALEPQAKLQAQLANILFGVGGGVALAGGVVWLVGGTRSDAVRVWVLPAPGGVVAHGQF